MTLESEKDVLDALNVNSFRNISREKVMELARMVESGDIDGGVLGLVMAQVPGLADQAATFTESADRTEERVFSSNDQGMTDVTALWETTLKAYLKQLEDPNISEEERRDIRDRIDRGNRMVFEKESENKSFLFAMDGSKKKFILDVAKGIAGAASVALAIANHEKLGLPGLPRRK